MRTISMGQSVLIAVIKREIDRMLSRRIYFVACIVLPLFSLFFMGTIFGDGQMENLPIGVVDGDNTVTSRQIIRMVKVDPTFRVTQYYANETEARADVQKKNIYGYLSIPVGFEAKVMDGKEVALTYYYHYALLSVGSEIHGAFQSLLKNISVSPIVTHAVELGVGEGEIKSFLLPVTTQNHPLFNPDMDYSVYLTHPFFFVFLQVLLLLVTTYAIGSEGKFGTSFEWLQTAGGNMLIAIIGKLLPYTIIFIAMSIFANYIYFGIFESYFSIVRTFYTGIGCISFFPISGIEYHYQRCVNGGFVGSYSFRSHISRTAHVCTGVLCFLSVSCSSFY